MPEEAKAAGAKVVGTGRFDFPNQVNNVLAFPGIFRGALDVRAAEINLAMKLAAVYAIADLITEQELGVMEVAVYGSGKYKKNTTLYSKNSYLLLTKQFKIIKIKTQPIEYQKSTFRLLENCYLR
jgi:malic enzyme